MGFNTAIIEKTDASDSACRALKNGIINFSEIYVAQVFCGRNCYIIDLKTPNALVVTSRALTTTTTTAGKVLFVFLTLFIAPLVICSVIKLIHRCSVRCGRQIHFAAATPPQSPPHTPPPLPPSPPQSQHATPPQSPPHTPLEQPTPSPLKKPLKNKTPKPTFTLNLKPKSSESAFSVKNLTPEKITELLLATNFICDQKIIKLIVSSFLTGLPKFQSPEAIEEVQTNIARCMSVLDSTSPLDSSDKIKIIQDLCEIFSESQEYQKGELEKLSSRVILLALSKIARKAGCLPRIVAALKRGTNILARGLASLEDKQQLYYLFIYKRAFALMYEKFNEPTYPKEKIVTLLSPLEPSAEVDKDGAPVDSGMKACPQGVGALLETIRNTIDVPADPQKILPWLRVQYAETVINTMVAQAAKRNKPELEAQADKEHPWRKILRDKCHDTNQVNAIIKMIGGLANLPAEMIKIAKKDDYAPVVPSIAEALADTFLELHTVEGFNAFMLGRINGSSCADRGLQEYREYIIKTLGQAASDTEIVASRPAIAKAYAAFGVDASDIDLSYYAQYHYCIKRDEFLIPTSDKLFNLNMKAIKKFIEITSKTK